MSWTEQEYGIIRFHQLHRYDAFANTGKVGLGRCGCGTEMYYYDHSTHFARELIAAGLAPVPEEQSITCPQCGRTSHNSNDVREKYCGNCHMYHDQMEKGGK